jgi:hypothetical protein
MTPTRSIRIGPFGRNDPDGDVLTLLDRWVTGPIDSLSLVILSARDVPQHVHRRKPPLNPRASGVARSQGSDNRSNDKSGSRSKTAIARNSQHRPIAALTLSLYRARADTNAVTSCLARSLDSRGCSARAATLITPGNADQRRAQMWPPIPLRRPLRRQREGP